MTGGSSSLSWNPDGAGSSGTGDPEGVPTGDDVASGSSHGSANSLIESTGRSSLEAKMKQTASQKKHGRNEERGTRNKESVCVGCE